MTALHIAVLVGSLRQHSYNRQLRDRFIGVAPPTLTFETVDIHHLPLYDQDDDDHQAESVQIMKRQIIAADGVLFITPEYNRSIPGVLKNAIDHGARPLEDSAWAGKPAGILGVSPGPMGTGLAQHHLRQILTSLDMPTMPQPEAHIQIIDDVMTNKGGLADESFDEFAPAWLNRYVEWITRFA